MDENGFAVRKDNGGGPKECSESIHCMIPALAASVLYLTLALINLCFGRVLYFVTPVLVGLHHVSEMRLLLSI